jgi:hypothetical protein
MKLWASFLKSDFLRLKILQIMFFSFYQTQNLCFEFQNVFFTFQMGF